MVVICDTSSLIRLYKTQTLYLLKSLFQKVYLPLAVYQECQGELKEAIDSCQFIICQPQAIIFTQFGAGERAALNLALETPYSFVLVDDKKAINAASRVSIKTITTLQCWVLAKQQKHLLAVKPYIYQLQEMGEGISEREIADILALANE